MIELVIVWLLAALFIWIALSAHVTIIAIGIIIVAIACTAVKLSS